MIRKNPFYILSSPHIFTVLVNIPIFMFYLAMPSVFFNTWYREPKILDASSLIFFGITLTLFGIGGYLGSHILLRKKSHRKFSSVLVPKWYIRIGMILALLAYMVWFRLGIQRAGGIGNFFYIYHANPFYVKSVVLKTVPGVTTLTQVAVAAIPLMICCSKPKRFDYALSGTILLFAVARSFLFSERLALLELLVPTIFLIVSTKRIKRKLVFIYIVIFLILAIGFFTLAESRRSLREWSSVENLIEAGAIRFLGYYMTSINNAIFFIQHFAYASPLYNTFSALWRFPGLRGMYKAFAGTNPIYAPHILSQYGMNPEFNTATAIGAWVIDFGLFGTPIVALFFGFFSGVLYRLASQNRFAAALYSVWLVGLLEFMRICYFTSTRLFPAYLFFIGALLLSKQIAPERRLEDG